MEESLKIIFPEGVPENLLGNPDILDYLQRLGSQKVEQLKKEEVRLADK